MISLNLNSNTRIMLIFMISTIVGAFLFGILGNLTALLFLNINTLSYSFDVDMLSKQQQVELFRITQPFNTIGTFLFSPLVMRLFFSRELSFKFSNFRISYSSILSASVLIFMVKPLVGWLASINNSIDFSIFGEIGVNLINISKLLAEKIALVTVSHSIEELMLNIFIIALIPAIAEELFFRGFLQQFLNSFTKNYHVSVWVTAIAFGIIHFNIINLLPLVFLGVILGYIYHYSQNIWISILAHFINNASLLWFVYKYSYDVKEVDVEVVPLQSVVLSFVLTAGLLFFMYTAWEHRNSINTSKD